MRRILWGFSFLWFLLVMSLYIHFLYENVGRFLREAPGVTRGLDLVGWPGRGGPSGDLGGTAR